jgi:hypothetical protein
MSTNKLRLLGGELVHGSQDLSQLHRKFNEIAENCYIFYSFLGNKHVG